MQKKTIWIVTDGFLPDHVGGISKSLDNEIKGLIILGFRVVVITRVADKEFRFGVTCVRFKGAIVIRYGIVKRNTLLYYLNFIFTIAFLPYILQKLRTRIGAPNSMYVHGPFQAVAIHLSKISKNGFHYVFHASSFSELVIEYKRRKYKSIGSIFLFLLLPIIYIIEAFGIASSNDIMVRSQFMYDELERNFFEFTKNKKIVIIPLSTDVSEVDAKNISRDEARKYLGISNGDFVFFTARRLVARMGLHNLLEAIILFNKYELKVNTHFLIAGKGYLHNILENIITNNNLKSVKMMGFINEGDLMMCYAAANCFILPTEAYEGFGLVTIESLAHGTPVLATPVAANLEVIGCWSPEFLTKSCNPIDIADGMIKVTKLIMNDEILIRKRAKSYCLEKYDINAVCSRIAEHLFQKVGD